MNNVQKATFSYEKNAQSQNSNHYHCVSTTHEKNISQISGMA